VINNAALPLGKRRAWTSFPGINALAFSQLQEKPTIKAGEFLAEIGIV
jgi:hypothetical protein